MRETRRLSAHFMTPALNLNLSSSFLQCSRDENMGDAVEVGRARR